MRQIIPALLLLSIQLLLCPDLAGAQPLTGVYAGLDLPISSSVGGGINRTDVVYCFRPDGTFTNNLEKPTWKTDVSGRYRVEAGKVLLTSQDGRSISYKLTDKGNLSAGRYQLFPMNGTRSIPPGLYTYTGITGEGASGQVSLTIDGKGNFSQIRSSSNPSATGDAGNRSSRNRDSNGTYSWKDGNLTLQFTTGQTEVHSFFYLPGGNPVMAVLDGRVYFQEDPNKVPANDARQSNKPTPGKPVVVAPFTDDALTLLKKANLTHGGKALDALKTVKVVGRVASLQLTTLIDLPQRRVRVELRTNDKLVSVEQLEGNAGWQWRNGIKTSLPRNRIDELTNVFTTGILGLRSAAIEALPPLQAKPLENGMTAITYQSNGALYMVMLNASNQLVGISSNLDKLQTTVVYTNMKSVAGVLLPFAEEQSAGSQKLTVRYDTYQLNPVVSAHDWQVPN